MFKLVIILAVVNELALSEPFSDDLIITLPDGQVQGITYLTANNKVYYGFQGIPYASPPIGNLRFESPQSPAPWREILDATKDSKSCISVMHWQNPDGESEDCLYINVYTPSLKPTEKLPVMFWIYGGAFVSGKSTKSLYGPDFLIEQDVILVSFNYRVGPFGFLSTGDSTIRGNFGLKDQHLALKWVNKNIKCFGGDPEKVTIFGTSAGGASSGLQITSPKSAGLFRAAIIGSGSAVTHWSIDDDPKSSALLLADTLSGQSYKGDNKNLKEFLQVKTAGEIINATITLLETREVWPPTIETVGEDAFLTESPYELLESGRFNRVPIVIGICSEESLMFLKDLDYAKQAALLHDTVPSKLIPSHLHQNASDDNAIITAVKNIYLKKDETFSSNLVAFADYFGDNRFTRGVIKHAELSSNYVPVYLYQFAYYGRSITPPFIDGAEKASHAAAVPFIFNVTGRSDTTDAVDFLTQNRMVQLWTNFAKYLNPTPKQSDVVENIIWPTITPTNLQYLNINTTLELRNNIKEKILSSMEEDLRHLWKETIDYFLIVKTNAILKKLSMFFLN